MLELLAPGRCALCARYLSLDERWVCLACRRNYPTPAIRPSPDGHDRLVALAFDADARNAMLDLKFRRAHWRARGLAALFAERIGARLGSADALVPVPLHPTRLRQRGFDQTAEITRRIARALGKPALPSMLRRLVHAAPQSSRPGPERAVPDGTYASSPSARGRRVALIDDITTSGNTLDACARALAEIGAEVVACCAVASGDTVRRGLDGEPAE